MENNTQSEVEKIKEEISQLQGILNCPDDVFTFPNDSSQGENRHQTTAATPLTTETCEVDSDTKLKDDSEHKFSQDDVSAGSQSSIGDLYEDEEGIEMVDVEPGSLEACLTMNQMYQCHIKEQLHKVQLALLQNRERQNEITDEYSSTMCRKERVKKDRALQSYFQSYFKDDMDQGPPPCEETIRRHAGGEPSPHTTPTLKWQPQLLKKLKDAVKSDGMQHMMQPILNRREVLMKKLQNINIAKEEKDEIKAAILELDYRLNEIKNLSDNELVGDRFRKVDWTKISMMDLEGKRSPFECQVQWQNQQHQSIDSTNWTPEEVRSLAAAVNKHGEHEWDKVAKEVGGGRLPWQCLQVYQQEITQDCDNMKFTEEEDTLLVKLVESFRIGNFIPFQKVAYFMNRGRRQVNLRWQTRLDPKLKLGAWTAEEDELLKQGYAKYGNIWHKVAECIPGRHANSVRERWLNSVNPNRKGGLWSIEEDIVLLEMILKYGTGKWKHMVVELALCTGATCQRSRNALIIRLRLLIIQITKFKKGIPEETEEDDGNDGLEIELEEEDRRLPLDSYLWMRRYVRHLKEKLVKRKQVMNLVEQKKWQELPTKTELCKLFSLSERNKIYDTKPSREGKNTDVKSRVLRKRKYKKITESDDDSQSEDDEEEEVAVPQPSKPKVPGRGRPKRTLMDTIVAAQIQHLLKPYVRHVSKERLHRMAKARQTLCTLRERNLKRSGFVVYTALLRVFHVDLNATASWIRRLMYGRKHGFMPPNSCKRILHKFRLSGKSVQKRTPSTLATLESQSASGNQQIQGLTTTALTTSMMVMSTQPTLTKSNSTIQGAGRAEGEQLNTVIAIPQIVTTPGHVTQPHGTLQTRGLFSQLPAPIHGTTSTSMHPGLPIVPQGSGMVQLSTPGQLQFPAVAGLQNQLGQVYRTQLLTLPLNLIQHVSALNQIIQTQNTAVPHPTLVHPNQNTLVTTPRSLTPASSVPTMPVTTTACSSLLNTSATSSSKASQCIQSKMATMSSVSPVVVEVSHTPRTGIQDTRSSLVQASTAAIAGQTCGTTVTHALIPGGKSSTTLITDVPVTSSSVPLQPTVLPQSDHGACSSVVEGCNANDIQKELSKTTSQRPMKRPLPQQTTSKGLKVLRPRRKSNDTELVRSSVDKNQVRTQSGARVLLPQNQLNASARQMTDNALEVVTCNNNTENLSYQSVSGAVPISTGRTHIIPQAGTSHGEHHVQTASQAATVSMLPQNAPIDVNNIRSQIPNQVSSMSLASLSATPLIQSMPRQSPGGPPGINQSLPHSSQLLSTMMSNIMAQGILPRTPGNILQSSGVISIPGQGFLVPVQNFNTLPRAASAQNILINPCNTPIPAPSATSINTPATTSVISTSSSSVNLPYTSLTTAPSFVDSMSSNTQGNNQSKVAESMAYDGKRSTCISLPYYDHSVPEMSRKILTIPDPGKEFSSEMLLIASLPQVEKVSEARYLVPIRYFRLFDKGNMSMLHKRKMLQVDSSTAKRPRLSIVQLGITYNSSGDNRDNMTCPLPEYVSQASPDNEGHTMDTSNKQTPSIATTTQLTMPFHESLVRLIFRSSKYWEINVSIAVDEHGTQYLINCIKEKHCSTKSSSVRIEIRPTTDKDEEIICGFVEVGPRKKPFRVTIPGLGEYSIYEDVTKGVVGVPTVRSRQLIKYRAQQQNQLAYLAPNPDNILKSLFHNRRPQRENTTVTPAVLKNLVPVFSSEELTKADSLISKVFGNTTQTCEASSIQFLPPNLANVKAFRGLLLHQKILQKRTEKFVLPDFIQERNKNAVEEANKLKETSKTSKDTSSKDSPAEGGEDDTSIQDPLHWIRQTPQYQLFHTRFRSLFAWPAILSRLPVNTPSSNGTRENTQQKKV